MHDMQEVIFCEQRSVATKIGFLKDPKLLFFDRART
jgi:hypothetical protein